jgi:hypothetical protein
LRDHPGEGFPVVGDEQPLHAVEVEQAETGRVVLQPEFLPVVKGSARMAYAARTMKIQIFYCTA